LFCGIFLGSRSSFRW